jgi:guanosine-3',5'-bis(diphosphate) 3'-pyrophosphohydrolase
VCLVVRHVFSVNDPRVLTAAVLHDTIEDTTTDYDDLRERFGDDVTAWIAALSKDKRRPEDERENEYMAGLASAPWQVQVCKLADIFDNLLDSGHFPPEKRKKTYQRSRAYLQALQQSLKPEAQPHWQTVSDLLKRLDG